MHKGLRAAAALPAVLFGVSGLGWVFDPTSAAANLGMTLPDGIARSTMIGDVGAFFLCLAAMIGVAVVTLQRSWFIASGLILATAAFMRIVAWGFHGADFAAQFIAVEVVLAALLLFAGTRAQS